MKSSLMENAPYTSKSISYTIKKLTNNSICQLFSIKKKHTHKNQTKPQDKQNLFLIIITFFFCLTFRSLNLLSLNISIKSYPIDQEFSSFRKPMNYSTQNIRFPVDIYNNNICLSPEIPYPLILQNFKDTTIIRIEQVNVAKKKKRKKKAKLTTR